MLMIIMIASIFKHLWCPLWQFFPYLSLFRHNVMCATAFNSVSQKQVPRLREMNNLSTLIQLQRRAMIWIQVLVTPMWLSQPLGRTAILGALEWAPVGVFEFWLMPSFFQLPDNPAMHRGKGRGGRNEPGRQFLFSPSPRGCSLHRFLEMG